MDKPVILFGNLPAAIKAFLEPNLDGVTVHPAVPGKRPKSFVTVEAAGGRDLSPVHESAVLMVDSWAESIESAHDLAQKVRAYLGSLRNEIHADVLIYAASSVGGLVWMPDPESQTPRYRQNFQIISRCISW